MSLSGAKKRKERGGVREKETTQVFTIGEVKRARVQTLPDTGEWPSKGRRYPREIPVLPVQELALTPKPAVAALGDEVLGSAVLSTLAGFVDTAGFLALFGLFTAHVTGDLITAASMMFERSQIGVLPRLMMLPVFMLSVAGSSLVARSIRGRGRPSITALLGMMTVVLAAFCALGVMCEPLALGPDAWGVALIGGAGVIAMGIQNTLMRDSLRSFSQTTMMTGNLTQFTIDLVELLWPTMQANGGGPVRSRSDSLSRLRRSGFPLMGFVAGACLGAWLTGLVGLASIALPTFAAAIVTILTWYRSREA